MKQGLMDRGEEKARSCSQGVEKENGYISPTFIPQTLTEHLLARAHDTSVRRCPVELTALNKGSSARMMNISASPLMSLAKSHIHAEDINEHEKSFHVTLL